MTCQECKQSMNGRKRNARFCSDACRLRHWALNVDARPCAKCGTAERAIMKSGAAYSYCRSCIRETGNTGVSRNLRKHADF